MTTPIPGVIATFMGLSFETNETVLVPRAETELLGRASLDILDRLASESGSKALRVIDMCCGAGNLACSVAHARPDIRVWASDLTDECVALARRNVTRHELSGRVDVRQGDLFGSLAGLELEGSVDVVICNPPYISTGKLANDSAHLLDGQPREAFDAGPYGIAIHKRVIADTPTFLRPGGWLAMEIGLGQEKQIEGLIQRAKRYEELQFFRDDNGAPRAVVARMTKDS